MHGNMKNLKRKFIPFTTLSLNPEIPIEHFVEDKIDLELVETVSDEVIQNVYGPLVMHVNVKMIITKQDNDKHI